MLLEAPVKRRDKRLPGDVADAVAAYAAMATWPAGFVVYQRGALADGLFIVRRGRIVLRSRVKAGRAFVPALAREGETFGWEGLGWSVLGTIVGLLLLLPAYAVGGMGAGDVKLLAGVGAWILIQNTVNSFCVSAVVGALMAVAMVVARRAWKKHQDQFWLILNEIMVIKDPEKLAEIAAERKSRMLLLPYGIPIAIGTIGYFLWMGMLV